MRVTKPILFFLFFLAILVLASCSNPKKDYEPIQQLQTASEQSIQGTSDDAIKLKSCDDVIKALDEFIKNHPEGEWNSTAKTDLASWKSKRTYIQESINSKLDFGAIQKLQAAAEQIMQHSNDYVVRQKNCDEIISTLQSYISKYPEGAWTTAAKTSLLSWQSRKTTLEQELSSLINRLSNQMRDRAISEAKKVHRMSNIEEVRLDKRNSRTSGANISVTEVYAIRMRGAIIGSSIFKLNITVSGQIDPATKQVFVDDNDIVEE